jgi:hypothetical protein
MICGSRTCKPNSVRGIAPAGRSFLWATHYCGAQATYPEVVARRAGTRPRRGLQPAPDFFPIWSCSVWGLPCPPHHCGGGALLPHLFTLTPAFPPGRYIFCGTFRRPGLNRASRTLSGTLLCGVRTFLPHHLTRQERPSGPAANGLIISDFGRRTSGVGKTPGHGISTDQKPFVVFLIRVNPCRSLAGFSVRQILF